MAVVTTKAKKGWGNFIVVVTIIDKEKEGDKIHLGGRRDEKNKKGGGGGKKTPFHG